jgi:hypothetical protein
MNDTQLNILADYATIRAIAADTKVSTRTIRRRIAGGWPFLIWGGKVHLHVPTVKKLIDAEVRTRKPAKGR